MSSNRNRALAESRVDIANDLLDKASRAANDGEPTPVVLNLLIAALAQSTIAVAQATLAALDE